MKIFALVTDAFGGRGGIAKFNRDLLTALCEIPEVEKVIAWPRVAVEKTDNLPRKLVYRVDGLNSKLKYVYGVIKDSFKNRNSKVLICGHLNLLPLACLIKLIGPSRKLFLITYGIEVWSEHSFLSKFFLKKVDSLISISEFTRMQMAKWAPIQNTPYFILPSSIELNKFSIEGKKENLIVKYGLKDKKVLLTLGRLAGKERGKGFDEVLELMPDLVKEDPTIRYIIAGDGFDRKRLETKAIKLGIDKEVIFTGYVDEETKSDLYRTADLFVMAGHCEGFGIVYLEALACGTPVIGSTLDGSKEALMDGKLGCLVDPENLDELKEAIQSQLQNTRKEVPALLSCYSFENYKKRVVEIFNAH